MMRDLGIVILGFIILETICLLINKILDKRGRWKGYE